MEKNRKKQMARNLVMALFILLFALIAEYVLKEIGLPETEIIVNTVSIIAIVWFTNSFIIGIISSMIAMCLFNYLFIDPVYTFAVNDSTYLIMLVTMTIVALLTSIVAKNAERDAQNAKEREEETKVLYLLNNLLSDANNMDDIVNVSLKAICDGLWCNTSCICFDVDGEPERKYRKIIYPTGEIFEIEREEDSRLLRYRIEKLNSTHYSSEEYWDMPLYGSEQILGVIRIDRKDADTFDESNVRLLVAMIESTAMAMDRLRKEQARSKTMADVARERYRANLLRAISHDIRTPLTGIIGTSEMLIDSLDGKNKESLEYAESIQSSARWLHSLVENILNLTRLQDDEFVLKKVPEALEEVVAVAIGHVMVQYKNREVEAIIPDEFIMVPMDAKLIEQVMINLIQNAIKHSGEDTQIEVEIFADHNNNRACCSVRDEGEGIPPEELEYIFNSFYTGDGASGVMHIRKRDGARSFGLGLSICETIISAHGGEIIARNREGLRGAEFLFTLPMEEKKEGSDYEK